MLTKPSIWPVILMLSIASSLCASETDADAKQFAEQIKPLFAKHCESCHRGNKPKGDFALDSLSLNFADKENRQRWLKVFEQLKAGTMPPKEKQTRGIRSGQPRTSGLAALESGRVPKHGA